jgi:2-polyprenyl-6-methoxyphenol hydroxylase-like FAD-dependent oxidoreductase
MGRASGLSGYAAPVAGRAAAAGPPGEQAPVAGPPAAAGPSGGQAPVLIAGAGPVGLVTALLLAGFGVPSVVCEAAPGRDVTGSRAICFQRDVLDILCRAGCGDALIAEGVTWTTGRTYFRGRELFSVTFPEPVPGGTPPWINISQARVEELLTERVASQPLISLRYGQRVTGFAQHAAGVEAEVAGRRGAVRLPGSYLVGADGYRSSVRELAGIGFPGRSFADRFLICDIRAELPFPSERRFYFDPEWNPGRQVLVHHCPDSVWRIDWQVPAGFDLDAERSSGALGARIRKITGEAPYEIVWASVYRFHERVAGRFSHGRVFLAGDAAHVYAPFGARGLNSGIADAENLAWKLAFAWHRWSPPELLASYQAERRPAALENLAVTSATMRFLAPQTPAEAARRAAVLERALADPAARTEIDSGKLAEPFRYADSPLTTPAMAGSGRPGNQEPVSTAPGALCPDGPCVVAGRPARLRQLFGGGIVVLTGSHADADEVAVVAGQAARAPVRSYARDDIDPDGGLSAVLGPARHGVLVVRPDGYVAAAMPRPGADRITAALRRATGNPCPGRARA